MTIFKEISDTCGSFVASELQRHYAGQTIKISRSMPELDATTLAALEPFRRCTIYVPRVADRVGRNQEILTLRSHGESYPTLVEIFGLSPRRLRSIVNL